MSAYQESRTVVAELGVNPSPAAALVVLFMAVTSSSIIVLLFINKTVFLPSLSLVSFATAGVVAAVAWTIGTSSDQRHITLWDISGVYAFVGFAGGMISEPAQVVEFMSLSADSIADSG
jgi:hypothetical protein